MDNRGESYEYRYNKKNVINYLFPRNSNYSR